MELHQTVAALESVVGSVMFGKNNIKKQTNTQMGLLGYSVKIFCVETSIISELFSQDREQSTLSHYHNMKV